MDDVLDLGAPATESPESPQVPSEATLASEEQTQETPENPVLPPILAETEAGDEEDDEKLGDVKGGIVFADPDPSYTWLNAMGAIIATIAVDSGVGSAPADRPSTFSIYPAPTLSTTNDYGVGSTRATIALCFEPPSFTASIDPGLILNG